MRTEDIVLKLLDNPSTLILVLIFGVAVVLALYKLIQKVLMVLKTKDITIKGPKNIGISVKNPTNPSSESKNTDSEVSNQNTINNTIIINKPEESKEQSIEIPLEDLIKMIDRCIAIGISIINIKYKIRDDVTNSQRIGTESAIESAISSIQISYRNKLKKIKTDNNIQHDSSIHIFNNKIKSDFVNLVYPKLYEIYKSEDLAEKGTIELTEICSDITNKVLNILRNSIINYIGCDLDIMEDSIKECSDIISESITDSISKAKIIAVEGENKLKIHINEHNEDITDTIKLYSKSNDNKLNLPYISDLSLN